MKVTMKEEEEPQKSTFSKLTEQSPHFEDLLALGRKLVAELDSEKSCDTLSRWMAHHIADLIRAAEKSRSRRAERACREAIYELWSHRAELPNGRRPFQDVEPVVRALESLDPSADEPRYFRTVIRGVNLSTEDEVTHSLFETINGIDSIARILIGELLLEASETASDNSRDWVTMAADAGLNGGPLEFVVNVYLPEKAVDPDEPERERLKSTFQKVAKFIHLATLLQGKLQEKIDQLSPDKGRSDPEASR
jgi:hypothetical protein